MKIELEAQWAEPVSLTFHSALRKLNTEPSTDASYQVSVHLAEGFQSRRFGGFFKIFSAETAWPKEKKRGWKHLCKVFYKGARFVPIR
jgi:hypothetical protein